MRSRKSSAKHIPAKSVKNSRLSPSILPGPILKIRKELVSRGDGLPEVEIDFAELEKRSPVDVVEGPADSNHTLLAILKRGRIIRLAGGVEDRGRIGGCWSDGNHPFWPSPETTNITEVTRRTARKKVETA